MTLEEKKRAFKRVSYIFSVKQPVLPNDFRRWGITSYDEARKFLEEFNESEMKEGLRWILSEQPYECRVTDPETGETRNGTVTGFFGKLDSGWQNRSAT